MSADGVAPRLKTLDGVRLGLLSTGKKNCDLLLDSIGGLLAADYNLAAVRRWTKPSVYRYGSRRRLEEVKAESDAVVAAIGDCGHGSSCTFHDVYWLEEQDLPVAYIDTPGRLHKVTRSGDVFVIEYATLKYVLPAIRKAPEQSRPAAIRKQFEKQGIYRALRQAGAQAGDRVRLMEQEFVLDEIPERPKNWLPESNGIDGYDYIEIPLRQLGRLDSEGVQALAKELLPDVVRKLVA